MAIILNIDTSSEVCSVCLADDGVIIAEQNELSPNQHASHLTTLIMKTVESAGLKLANLSAVALSSGPGSYTGLRIGASVAKGICYGLDKPLIGVSTLQAIAYQMARVQPDPGAIYISMLDARRDDAYISIYDHDNNPILKDVFVTLDGSFMDILAPYNVKKIYLGGPGSVKAGKGCLNNEFGTIIENIICIASNINTISYKRFIGGVFENTALYEPFYLKEFEGRMKNN